MALTQAVKQRLDGRVIGIDIRQTIGQAAACPCVVCEERLNGVLRDRLNCLTRKTHAFAKQTHTWDAAVTLCLFEHNWLRPHSALRQARESRYEHRHYRKRTAAMALGLTHHVWSWTEFLSLQIYQYHKE